MVKVFPLDWRTGDGLYYTIARRYMIMVIGLQAIVCVIRFACLKNVQGGLLMGLIAFLGYYAVREDMNMNLICAWGLACACIGTYDMLNSILGYLLTLLKMNPLTTFLQALVPLAYFLGAVLGYQIFRDHEAKGGTFQAYFQNGEANTQAIGNSAKIAGAGAAAMAPIAAPVALGALKPPPLMATSSPPLYGSSPQGQGRYGYGGAFGTAAGAPPPTMAFSQRAPFHGGPPANTRAPMQTEYSQTVPGVTAGGQTTDYLAKQGRGAKSNWMPFNV